MTKQMICHPKLFKCTYLLIIKTSSNLNIPLQVTILPKTKVTDPFSKLLKHSL